MSQKTTKGNFFQTMTSTQYRELMGLDPIKRVEFNSSKYGNKKTTIAGKTFDSKRESKDWLRLKSMEDSGIITNLKTQVPFELQPKYVTKDGRKIRAITYVADFVYEHDGKTIVQDSKGMRTDVYKIKRKMFEYKYPDYTFIES